MTMQTLTMPRLGETMEEGLIVGWLVAPGVAFRRGDPILELETDKTVVEYPALGDGVLQEVLVGPGDRVAVGAPIARADVVDAADWSDSGADRPAPVSLLAMPRLGETMEQGLVVQWLVAEGAAYARGDAILEIETDKTVAEVPALSDGRLLRILAHPGARVTVGHPIAEVEGEVEAVAVAAAPAKTTAPAKSAAPVGGSSAPAPRQSGERLRATPLARRTARNLGIALGSVQGTGRRGRIERADVERSASAPAGHTQLAHDIEGSAGRMHLLIHGFAGDRTAWAATASGLRRAGHRTAVIDLPGHGDTGIEATDLAAMTDAVVAFAQTLPGPLVLVGHSMGAAVAVAVSARLAGKVSGLVLLTPAGCGPRIAPDFVHGMAAATTAGEVAHLLRLLGPKGGAVSGAALDQMATQARRGRLRALAATLSSSEGRQRIDLLRTLATLPDTLPIRAIFGLEDGIVSAKDALNMPPRVAVHFLPTGHMPQWDAPSDIVNLILKGASHD